VGDGSQLMPFTISIFFKLATFSSDLLHACVKVGAGSELMPIFLQIYKITLWLV